MNLFETASMRQLAPTGLIFSHHPELRELWTRNVLAVFQFLSDRQDQQSSHIGAIDVPSGKLTIHKPTIPKHDFPHLGRSYYNFFHFWDIVIFGIFIIRPFFFFTFQDPMFFTFLNYFFACAAFVGKISAEPKIGLSRSCIPDYHWGAPKHDFLFEAGKHNDSPTCAFF